MDRKTQEYAAILAKGGYVDPVGRVKRSNPANRVSDKDIDTLIAGGFIRNPSKASRKRSNPAPTKLDPADIELLASGGFISPRGNPKPTTKSKPRKPALDLTRLPQEIKSLEDTAKGESLAEAAIDNLSDPKTRLLAIKSKAATPRLLQTYTTDDTFEWVGLKGHMLCLGAEHLVPNSLHPHDLDLICGVALAPTHPKAVLPIPMHAPIVDIEMKRNTAQGFALLGSSGDVSIGAILSGSEVVCVQISSALHKQYKTWVESGKPSGKNSPLMRFLDRNLF